MPDQEVAQPRRMTLKERNRLLVFAEEQEQSARIFAQGGTVPNPELEMPVSAQRCRNRAAAYRAVAAEYKPVIEGEE